MERDQAIDREQACGASELNRGSWREGSETKGVKERERRRYSLGGTETNSVFPGSSSRDVYTGCSKREVLPSSPIFHPVVDPSSHFLHLRRSPPSLCPQCLPNPDLLAGRIRRVAADTETSLRISFPSSLRGSRSAKRRGGHASSVTIIGDLSLLFCIYFCLWCSFLDHDPRTLPRKLPTGHAGSTKLFPFFSLIFEVF